jgi:hypothetical protein
MNKQTQSNKKQNKQTTKYPQELQVEENRISVFV